MILFHIRVALCSFGVVLSQAFWFYVLVVLSCLVWYDFMLVLYVLFCPPVLWFYVPLVLCCPHMLWFYVPLMLFWLMRYDFMFRWCCLVSCVMILCSIDVVLINALWFYSCCTIAFEWCVIIICSIGVELHRWRNG
jgi:hypothetical protein